MSRPTHHKSDGAAYRRAIYKRVYGPQPGEPPAKSKKSALFQLAIRTQSEVAEILGISRQAVHQAERRAIFKIRSALMPYIIDRKLADGAL